VTINSDYSDILRYFVEETVQFLVVGRQDHRDWRQRQDRCDVVDHAVEYVRGEVHTNGMENLWSLLKRTLGGTYVSVEPFHLFRHLDEQAFRYNHRKGFNDGQRFDLAVRQIVGKRLTWDQLTGKTDEAETRTEARC
jgi:ISXO2-like transposase domain